MATGHPEENLPIETINMSIWPGFNTNKFPMNLESGPDKIVNRSNRGSCLTKAQDLTR